MAGYFFHHQKSGQLIQDEEGEEYPSLETVRKEAVLSARDIIAEAAKQGRNATHESFLIVDDLGQTVLVLKFADALTF